MGGIAAVFSESRTDTPELVARMLRAMEHRAKDGAAVAWGTNLEFSLPALRAASSRVALGYGFTKILPTDVLQPIRAGEGWFCLDGRIIVDRRLVGGEEAARALDSKLNPAQFSSIQQATDGAYSVYSCIDDALFVTRDPLGLKPTFMGRGKDLMAVASDRKALWALGINDIVTLPPAGCLKASSEGVSVEWSDPICDQAEPSSNLEIEIDDLSRALVESVSIQTASVSGTIAVAFSGGVDSTVIAKIAKDLGVNVLLITIGIGQTSEMTQAESTAKEIGLPIIVKQFSKHDLEKYLDHVLWLIEEPDLMKVSIALAVYWTAEVASMNGCPLVMLGQGSDELFGGYKRFANIMGEKGPQAASAAISDSIRRAHDVNYQRDDQAISSLRAELRLPFVTKRMVEISSRTPLKMKVRSGSDNIRKWILREAAIRLGVSSAVAMRPKKAIQHASGIEKTIREAARNHSLTPLEYLETRLRHLRKGLSARLDLML